MSTDTIKSIKVDFLDRAYQTFKEEGMLQEEVEILRFLQDSDPGLIPAFTLSLKKGRQGILQRLAGSLLREDVLGSASNSYDLYVVGSSYALNVPAIDEYWQKIIGKLYTYGLQSDKVYKLFPLWEEECLVIPISRTFAFNRIEVDGIMLHAAKENIQTLDHPVELLELMRQKEKNDTAHPKHEWAKLAEELTNGSANLTLSYAYWSRKKKELQQKAQKCGIPTSIDWALGQKNQNPQFDSSLFFEQLCVEGHNLHPGTKTKLKMQPKDVFQYAPEFDGIAAIRFVGIHKKNAEWSTIQTKKENVNALLFKEYPGLFKAVEKQFSKNNLFVDDYIFVPVHPWQMENAVQQIYWQEIKEQLVVPIEEFFVPCGSTSSFRTLVPIKREEKNKLAIKVAVNSQMTSTIRSISPTTTNNAAVFTRLIRFIMQKEEKLAQTFVPVCEYAGFNFKSNNNKGCTETKNLQSRNLSAVLRENVEAFLAQNEIAVVGSSLFAQSPISEKLIFIELIEKINMPLQKAALYFVSEYASVVLPGFLTLMAKYGIGLEGHLQNSVIVFQGGKPVRMLFRDWGGTRIYKKRLDKSGFNEPFYPESLTIIDSLTEMHNKVFYTVLQNHFGELILQVCKHFGIREEELWKEVYQVCEKVFNQIDSNPLYSHNTWLDRKAIYQANVEHKALTKMRLQKNEKSYAYSTVPNPLFQFAQKEQRK